MCGDCVIPGFCKFYLLDFLHGNSINVACFSTWCSILISNTIFILWANWCSYKKDLHALVVHSLADIPCISALRMKTSYLSFLWPSLIEVLKISMSFLPNMHSSVTRLYVLSEIALWCKTNFTSMSVVWWHLKYLVM